MDEKIECQKCGREIGIIVKLAGSDWLNIGGLIVRYVYGVCSGCGHPFYWSASERALSALVQSVLATRNEK